MIDAPKKKYLDPELYFIKKDITIGDPDFGEEVSVSQLVKQGETLADYPNYNRLKKKGFFKNPIESGEFTEFSEDENSLIATATGYPKKRLVKQGDNEPKKILISISPFVKISHDKLKATIDIRPPIPDTPSLKGENLKELIESAGVTFGLNHQAIKKAQHFIEQENFDFEKFTVAQGEYPGEGTDARLKYELEIGPLAGMTLEDGSIDFRDRKVMVSVNEGHHIATKIPAVPGSVGHNVFGEEIEPKTGKDIRVKVSGDALFERDTNHVIAKKAGALSVVNQDTIKVSAKHKIMTDIDYATGNVESGNSVQISGSVLPGFKVEVGGDLEIGGSISEATISCEGNTVIKGGITGQKSHISSAGDVDFKFIERASITSGGLVVIRKQSYYSDVSAASDIRCQPSSKIMGGIIIAGGNLTVGDVGADNCEPALLAAGVDAERYELYNQLQKQLIDQQDELIQTMQLLGRGARSKKARKMEKAIDANKIQLLKLNLIPGTELYSRVGNAKNRDEMDDEDPLYQTGIDIEKIRIEIYGTIYAGTKILIGNRSATLSDTVTNRSYRLSKNLKRIMAIPLEKNKPGQ